jgi:hypothetical protein
MFRIFLNINSISYSFRSIANQNGVRYSDSTSYFKKYSSSKYKQTVCLHYGLDFHFNVFYYTFSDGEQKSWNDANSSCANALQVPTGKNTYLMNSENKSYWLGIYKKKSCETHIIANLTNVMELKLSKCPYVGNDLFDEQDCYAKSRAICVQPGKSRLM